MVLADQEVLEAPPTLRRAPSTEELCAAHCAGLPTTAWMACMASCREGNVIDRSPVISWPAIADRLEDIPGAIGRGLTDVLAPVNRTLLLVLGIVAVGYLLARRV